MSTPTDRARQRKHEATRRALIVAHILAGRSNEEIMYMTLHPNATAAEIEKLRRESLR